MRPGAVCDYYANKLGMDMSGNQGWASSLIEKLNGNWKIDYARILQEKSKLMDAIFEAVGREKVRGGGGRGGGRKGRREGGKFGVGPSC